MPMIEPMIAELQHEAGVTRKLLERVPEDRFDYKPHPKSMSLRELASHLVDSLGWVDATVNLDELHIDPTQWKPFVAQTRAELLAAHDRNLAAALGIMKGVSDEKLLAPWTMRKADGTVAFSMPRVAVLRAFIIKHIVHHRGQLTVYLRLLDVPLPQVYGPSADEPNM